MEIMIIKAAEAGRRRSNPAKLSQAGSNDMELRLDGVRTNSERPALRTVSPHRLRGLRAGATIRSRYQEFTIDSV
jgi:hypothetical protein